MLKGFGHQIGRHAGYRSQCSLAKKSSREIGFVELWRDLGPKYSAIPVVLCHSHVPYVDTGKPVELHVSLAKVLDQD